MPLAQCVGKLVMLKVTFLTKPASAKIASLADSGIWIDGGETAAAIQRAAAGLTHEAIPAKQQFLNQFPLLFVPLTQIEWLAAAQQI